MFVNKDICSKCGGACCKRIPGACYPEDFGLPGSFVAVYEALASGKYAIDWWEGDARDNVEELSLTYFVRPATKNKVGILYDPAWGGECVFLADNGCVLNEEARPLNCKKLEPREEGECMLHDKANKQNAAISWIPYQDKLRNISLDTLKRRVYK